MVAVGMSVASRITANSSYPWRSQEFLDTACSLSSHGTVVSLTVSNKFSKSDILTQRGIRPEKIQHMMHPLLYPARWLIGHSLTGLRSSWMNCFSPFLDPDSGYYHSLAVLERLCLCVPKSSCNQIISCLNIIVCYHKCNN